MPSMIEVEVANRQNRPIANLKRLVNAAEQIVANQGWQAAQISIAVVGDAEMRRLNRDHLGHDYTTDVLSFVLDDSEARLLGEIVVSSDVAVREAARRGVDAGDELLLYVVHGLLHLVGMRDKSPSDRAGMRVAEQHWLAVLGVPQAARTLLEVDVENTAFLGEQLR
jgi:probable rRNA maturation factor